MAAHPARATWSVWPLIFGVTLVAYGAAFAAVIAIGAGFTNHTGTPTPATVALVNVAAFIPTPTLPPTPTPHPPTPTPAPPTAPPSTPTPDPNVDFRVPLAASNTGTFGGQRVSILNITDDARPVTSSVRSVTGNKFITVEVLIENLGTAPVTLGKWQMRTTPGGDVSASVSTGFGTPLPTSDTVAPHAIVNGTLVFSVPIGARVTWIRYAPNPTARGALYFDAS